MAADADMGMPEPGVMHRACGYCTLKELCWPIGLEPADLALLQTMVRHTGPLAAGSYLFRAGDPFTAIYAVREGCIKSCSIDAGGHEAVHSFHLRGEVLGFDAVYPDRHRCNALILETSSLCVIPYRDIARLSTEFRGLYDQVLRVVSREFSRQLRFAEGAGASQRIAGFLLDLRSRLQQASAAAYEITLPMSREDIANYLRITPETLSRLFRKLQRKGLIEVDRRHIFLADPIRLDLMARGIR